MPVLFIGRILKSEQYIDSYHKSKVQLHDYFIHGVSKFTGFDFVVKKKAGKYDLIL